MSSNKMSTPLVDRTNTQKSAHSTTTTATSSFLPDIGSTPPMPTFQKPDLHDHPSVRKQDDENTTPTRLRGQIPRKPVLPSPSSRDRLHSPPPLAPWRPATTVPLRDRMGEIFPLPQGWGTKHDIAICILDVYDYSLKEIVLKVRKAFGKSLMGPMNEKTIDKRLRQLDQDIESTCYKEALKKMKQKEEGRANANAGMGLATPARVTATGAAASSDSLALATPLGGARGASTQASSSRLN